jgi:hypothetical protein
MPTRPVDLNNIKGRIAEALVESIFRRAEFKMTRFGRESDLRGMMKTVDRPAHIKYDVASA